VNAFPNLCPYSCKKIARIPQHPLPHGGVIRNMDLLHLSNNIFHPHGGLIHLKIDPRNKIERSRFARKVMYSNFERKENSQLESIALMHHPSTLGLGVHTRVKWSKLDSFLYPTFLLHQMFN